MRTTLFSVNLSLSASGIIAAPLPNEGALETMTEIERETQRAAELTRRRDHAGAEAVYVTLNKRFPRNASILYELGRSRYRLQKYKSAAEALGRAVALVPNDPQSMLVLGAVYHEQGPLDEAIEIFRRALALKPGDPVIQRYLKRSESDRAWRDSPPRFNKPRKETSRA